MRNDKELLEELSKRVNSILFPETIQIEVVENIAVLRGRVSTAEKRNEAAMAAADVPGIEGIDNRLIIRASEYIL